MDASRLLGFDRAARFPALSRFFHPVIQHRQSGF